jgi:hypothetical protein
MRTLSAEQLDRVFLLINSGMRANAALALIDAEEANPGHRLHQGAISNNEPFSQRYAHRRGSVDPASG